MSVERIGALIDIPPVRPLGGAVVDDEVFLRGSHDVADGNSKAHLSSRLLRSSDRHDIR